MTKEEIKEILQDLHPEVDFDTADKLVDDKIFTSFDVVAINAEVADRFDLIIPAGEIRPVNYNSLDAIYNMIERIAEEN